MSMRDALLNLCPSTIRWSPLVARDAYGNAVYDRTRFTDYPGRAAEDAGRRAIAGAGVGGAGAEVLHGSVIYILGTPDLHYDDGIQLDGGPMYPVKEWNIIWDRQQPLYVKVILGSAIG